MRVSYLALVSCFLLLVQLISTVTAQSTGNAADEIAATASRATEVGYMITEYTAIPLNPVMGLAAFGAWTYLSTPEDRRASLPWYFQLWFVGSCAFLSLGVLLKGYLLPFAPFLKTPLDAITYVMNAFAAAVVFVPKLHDLVVGNGGKQGILGGLPGLEVVAHAADGSEGAGETPWILAALVVAFAAIAYWAIWLLGNLVNALILANPIPFLDVILLGIVLGAMATLGLAAWIHPLLGIALSLGLVFFAVLIAGWTFRWTVLATIFSWDILTVRRDRRWRSTGILRAFSARGMPNVPPRTMGQLKIGHGGEHCFSYRFWIVGPTRSVAVRVEALQVGISLTHPCLIRREGQGGKYRPIIRLAPRYRGQEQAIGHALGAPCCDIGVRRGIVAAWRWIREQVSSVRSAHSPRSATA